MKPEVCKNCCGREFVERDDAYVCAYCDSRYPKPPVVPMEEVYIPKPEAEEPNISQFYSDPINFKQQTTNAGGKNKWIAFFLCLFLGVYGGHKFYEGKFGMGLLYFFTGGLFCIGWIVDCIGLLCKPNPYYV